MFVFLFLEVFAIYFLVINQKSFEKIKTQKKTKPHKTMWGPRGSHRAIISSVFLFGDGSRGVLQHYWFVCVLKWFQMSAMTLAYENAA